ncbi:CDP-alcohol phosphatidyltransferase family protein [Actinocorallia longicatena]|uniref:CDP-alcohol phosphatidyltransferase-like enzyme n=1 Tax=Actinocorallia longicatena TaxID=111803 RepID=A0ABP6QGD7_9ACTN
MSYSLADVRGTLKASDSWWTVYCVDPLAIRLTRCVANRTRLTPGAVTAVAFGLGLAAAGAFATGALVLGAALSYLCFLADCVDGKLARLKGLGSAFGEWLDYILDRVRTVVCAAALGHGLYAATGDSGYLLFAAGVVLVDVFRYLNGQQIGKARRSLAPPVPAPRAPVPERARDRVRRRYFSGIEFQMAVFVVGPLTGLVVQVTACAAAALLCFELHLIHAFWRQTRRAATSRMNPSEPVLAE